MDALYDNFLRKIRQADSSSPGGSVAAGKGTSIANGVISVRAGTTLAFDGDDLVVNIAVLDDRYADKAKYGDDYINLTDNDISNSQVITCGATISVGQSTTKALGMGTDLDLNNSYTALFGQHLGSIAQYQFVIGCYNATDSDAYFEVGAGTSNSTRRNVFTVRKTGETLVDGWLTVKVSAGTFEVLPSTIEKVQNTDKDIVFSLDRFVYVFSPAEASTITFTPPALEEGKLYRAELWIVQDSTPVDITFPSLTWPFAAPNLSRAGLYRISLLYDGVNWFGFLLEDSSAHTQTVELTAGATGVETIALCPGTITKISGEITDLRLSYSATSPDTPVGTIDSRECGVIFTTGGTGTAYGGGFVQWEGGREGLRGITKHSVTDYEANKSYVISVQNGLLVSDEWTAPEA